MDYSARKKQKEIVVRLDKGDPVIESFREIAKECRITSGQICGIGAVADPEVGYYQLENQEYKKDTMEGSYELTNLTGIISKKDGGVHVHAHVTLADESHQAFGGHLHRATIAAAGEFWIYESNTRVQRQRENSLGLDLMHFSE